MTNLGYKFNNFPNIFCVSLNESIDRRINLYKQLCELKLQDKLFFNIYPRFKDCNYILNGNYVDHLHQNSKGPVTSHIKINEYWTKHTDLDYALIVEDDVSFITSNFWNFTWEEFFYHLPDNWECLQLYYFSETAKPQDTVTFNIRERYYDDWGCQAYLIKRNYAEKMVNRYLKDKDIFNLTLPSANIKISKNDTRFLEMYPLVEHIVYETLGQTYCFPLLLEDVVNTKPTGYSSYNNEESRIAYYNYIYQYWKNNGFNHKLA